MKSLTVTQEMLDEARRLSKRVAVSRTKASEGDNDTTIGILGELLWAQFMYRDWRKNSVGRNMGRADDGETEIKCSAYPYRETLNLLVREDYALKRKPKQYVQILLNVPEARPKEIPAGTEALVVGWATPEQVDAAEVREFTTRNGVLRCKAVPFTDLKPFYSTGGQLL